MTEKSQYLEYLDKEMTIMGILSTFCLAAVALTLDRVGTAPRDKQTLFSDIWKDKSGYVILGSVLITAAGALFYKQRSNLAWFYGKIALSFEAPSLDSKSLDDWYRDADSWTTWIPYQNAFVALVLGATYFLIALSETARLVRVPIAGVTGFSISLIVVQTVRAGVFYRHKYAKDPIGIAFPFYRKAEKHCKALLRRGTRHT